MWRTDSSEKTLILGKIKARRSRGWLRMRWLDGITDSMDMDLRKLGSEQTQGGSEAPGSLVSCSPRGTESQTWLGDWTTTMTTTGRVKKTEFLTFRIWSLERADIKQILSQVDVLVKWIGPGEQRQDSDRILVLQVLVSEASLLIALGVFCQSPSHLASNFSICL